MTAVRDVLTHLDFKKANELQNALVHKLAEAPGSPVEGQIYYDTAAHKLYYRSNSAWVSADASAIVAGNALTRTGDTLDVAPGTGLEISADTIRIAAAAAGEGLAGGGGSALSVTAGAGIEVTGDAVRINATAAGAGLTGGGGSALAVGDGNGLTVNENDVAVNVGTGLEISADAVRIAAAAAGGGLTGGAGSALAVGAGTGITVNADDVAVNTAVIATREYVDSTAQGLDTKASVKYATAAALSPANTLAAGVLTATENGVLKVDGKEPEVGDRVLVKDEGEGKKDGIYTVTATGSAGAKYKLTRATDADVTGELTAGAYVYVEAGNTLAASGWVLKTTGTITIDTTAQEWIQFSGAGQITAGAGLTKTGNTLDAVANADESLIVNANDIQVNSAKVPFLAVANTFTKAQAIRIASGIPLSLGTAEADSWRLTIGAGVGDADIVTPGAATWVTGGKLELASGSGKDIAIDAQGSGVIKVNENRITLVADPTSAQDAATKAYVDARTYSASIGDGAKTEITVEHKLGSEDVDVTVRYAGGTKALVDVAWAVSTADKIILYFNTAPAAEALRVKVSK